MSRIPKPRPYFTGNKTPQGEYYGELARDLHDQLFGPEWLDWINPFPAVVMDREVFPTDVSSDVANPQVSVGPGTIPILQPRPSVPEVVPPPPGLPTGVVPLVPDRGAQPSITPSVPIVWTQTADGRWSHPSWGGGWTLSGANTISAENGIAPPATVAAPPVVVTPEPTPEPQEDNVGWISDVYDVLDASTGGWLPGGVDPGSSLPGQVYQTLANPAPTVQVPSTQPPAAPGTPGQSMNDGCGGTWVYKRHCGQWRWVKQRRRRRKRIATQQDVKDIASIKGVLGGGKALETWIATHG